MLCVLRCVHRRQENHAFAAEYEHCEATEDDDTFCSNADGVLKKARVLKCSIALVEHCAKVTNLKELHGKVQSEVRALKAFHVDEKKELHGTLLKRVRDALSMKAVPNN